jgi:hypothetical protein
MVLEKLDLIHLLEQRIIQPFVSEAIGENRMTEDVSHPTTMEQNDCDPPVLSPSVPLCSWEPTLPIVENEQQATDHLLAIPESSQSLSNDNKENVDLLKNLDMGEDRLSALHPTKPPLTGIEALEAPFLGISPGYEEEY